MRAAWVIGSGGMLGKALAFALETDALTTLFTRPFDWASPAMLRAQFASAVESFAEAASQASAWEIYWTAGTGTFASSQEAMAQETESLRLLLGALQAHPHLCHAPGCLTLASSAGAIYAGSREYVITESTPTAPTTAYAREKLVHERLLTDFAAGFPNMRVFLARISTIYGTGQARHKAQGLLTHVARCVLRNKPVHIYVPFDTIRDYIAAADAARELLRGARTVAVNRGATMKLVASEHPVTIAEIIGHFNKIARRNTRAITSANQLSALYQKRIQFRSIVQADGPAPVRTPLLIGLSQLFADERRLLALGQ
jgi:UDP-glucose 4-epimerase